MILKQAAEDIAKAFTKWGLWSGSGGVENVIYDSEQIPKPETIGRIVVEKDGETSTYPVSFPGNIRYSYPDGNYNFGTVYAYGYCTSTTTVRCFLSLPKGFFTASFVSGSVAWIRGGGTSKSGTITSINKTNANQLIIDISGSGYNNYEADVVAITNLIIVFA